MDFSKLPALGLSGTAFFRSYIRLQITYHVAAFLLKKNSLL